MEQRLPRKLAAILHADVCGYSRLAEQDEDNTHRKLKESLARITNLVNTYHGRVINYSGDAALTMFESVMDAVSCAIAIQHDLSALNENIPDERKVLYRIGINLGYVIEDGGDIFGDGVNVAARLEGLASPGGICVSDSVYKAIGNKLPLEYEDIGTQSVKNIAESVQTYRVKLRSGEELPSPSNARGSHKKQSLQNWRLISILFAVGLIVIAGFAFWFESQNQQQSFELHSETVTLPLPGKPSVAVLPFDNLSNDPDQSYFADGLTEDLRSGPQK